jgi:plastocyanin
MGLLHVGRSTGALTFAVLVLTGCGGQSKPAHRSAATAGGPTITIQDFKFQPASLTVTPGAKVTVVNKDTAAHTVTSIGTNAFDTGTIAGGRTSTFTAPTARRIYAYVCNIHEYMHGALVVK